MSRLFFSAVAVCAIAVAAPASAVITVSLEAPGVQTSSTTPAFLLTFETAGFPTGVTGNGISVMGANAFGGAGGVGSYGYTEGTATLSFTATPVTNFGLWASALDGATGIEFFSAGALIGGFNLRDAFFANGGTNAYNGNPNPTFLGQDGNEQFAYFNFTSDTAFDSVNLYGDCCNGRGRFEFDNVAIGVAPPVGGAVPEPATWGMMIVGFGVVGASMRRRKPIVHFS